MIKRASLRRNPAAMTPIQAAARFGSIYDQEIYGALPDYVAHFWPFDLYRFGHVTPYIYDVVGGAHFAGPANKRCSAFPLDDAYHCGSINGERRPTNGSQYFECFANRDWMILVASKGRGNSCFEFTLGNTGSDETPESIYLKLQPYYFCVNYHSTYQSVPWGNLHTKQRTASTVNRVVGQEYMVAYVKRGDYIQHWVDGVMQGQNQISLLLDAAGRTYGTLCATAYNNILNMRPIKQIRIGHSGTGLMNQALKSSNPDYDYPHVVDGDTAAYVEIPTAFGDDGKSVVNERTQYSGVSINSWAVGAMPADVAGFMNWHKTQWFAGNKRLDWPG